MPRATLDEAIDALGGIPLRRYCQITGETPNAVYLRKNKGVWIEGVELYKPEGSDWWVDLGAIQAWRLRNGQERHIVDDLKDQIHMETQVRVSRRLGGS